MMKIKNTNIFQHQIIRMKLHFQYAEATKIKHENLTDEYFYELKFPDLRQQSVLSAEVSLFQSVL